MASTTGRIHDWQPVAIGALGYWLVLIGVSLPGSPFAFDIVRIAVLIAGLPVLLLLGIQLDRVAREGGAAIASRDFLTSLPNRRAFAKEATRRLNGAQTGTIAVLLFDVDALKTLNDECGHLAGDELLVRFANHLANVAPGTRAYRLGGDEFAVLIDRNLGESAASIIDASDGLTAVFRSCGHEHAVRATAGFASNQEGDTYDSLFQRVDERLLLEKKRLYAKGGLPERRASLAVVREAPTDETPEGIASLEERRRKRVKERTNLG